MRKLHLLTTLLAFAFILNSCKKDQTRGLGQDLNDPTLGFLDITTDSVEINPTGYCPLSAQVNYSWETSGKTKIIVRGKHGVKSNIEHTFNDEGLHHSIPVIGLYPDYENIVDIILTNAEGNYVAKKTILIQTGALPADLPNAIAVTHSSDKMDNGLNLVSNFSRADPQMPIMVDSYGDIRWVLDYSSLPELKFLAYGCGFSRLRNGNLYFASSRSHKIYEIDLFGKILHSWGLNGDLFHHDIQEKPDGNFLVLIDRPGSKNINNVETIEDFIIEIDRNTGNTVNVWDLKESLDEMRKALTTDEKDWIHTNAIIYDSTDNCVIVSGRTQGIIKLTYDNKVKWILSAHKGWGKNRRNEDLNQFLLTPLDATGKPIANPDVAFGSVDGPDFEWNWYQHSPTLMPNGNLLLFDNGDSRNFDSSPLLRYSRAVAYKIDPVNLTVQQVWAYGKEREAETFSRIVSKVQYLPQSNHVLFCPGYQVPNTVGKGGKIVEIDYATKEVVFEMEISSAILWGFHQSERMSAYPANY